MSFNTRLGISITDVGLLISELGFQIQIWVFLSERFGALISELGLQ